MATASQCRNPGPLFQQITDSIPHSGGFSNAHLRELKIYGRAQPCSSNEDIRFELPMNEAAVTEQPRLSRPILLNNEFQLELG